ncbi:MAG TPA: Crp/Fnr family transcriptional regulator [Flavisolibacter sp.]|jgi:CRP-like cAMP-binding protein|nr:Crp/Fnr family transcriptional regulator [Flavisolibacter sp.]
MYDLFFKTLSQKIELTADEKELFASYLTPKKLRRKQYILQEGEVSRHTIFVEKGLLRSYAVDDKGTERIIQFAPEGWFISDLYSYITGEPSVFNIDALEDCELVLISKNATDELRARIPKYLEYSFLQMQNAYVATQRRLFDMVNLSTEEKYSKLAAKYPDLLQRVPQHMIASYLGLTPETLSRARRQMALRKR